MVDILQRSPHYIAAPLAAAACAHFLRSFRACPDNAAVPLDAWRTSLWSAALPPAYRHLATALYGQWLELRFRYLALTTTHVALLQRLRADGYRLALITNGPSAAQWEKVRRLNVARLFDAVIVSGDLAWEKPDPRIFEMACRDLGVSAAQCVMVGDKLDTDIQGGIEANLGGTIWTPLTVDETHAARPIKPSYIVHSLSDMRAFLPPLNNNAATTGRCSTDGPTMQTAALTPRRSSVGSKAGGNGNVAHSHMAAKLHSHLRVASLPDLDSGNSNSSDGS